MIIFSVYQLWNISRSYITIDYLQIPKAFIRYEKKKKQTTPNSVVMTERIFVSLMDVRFDGKSHRSHFTWVCLKVL